MSLAAVVVVVWMVGSLLLALAMTAGLEDDDE